MQKHNSFKTIKKQFFVFASIRNIRLAASCGIFDILKISLLLSLFSSEVCAAANSLASENTSKILVKKIEFSPKNNLEISVSDKANFKIFTLADPDRLVIDIENAAFEKEDYKPTLPYFISSFRSRIDQKNSLRIVFDANQKMNIEKTSFHKIKNNEARKITAQFSILKPESEQVVRPKAQDSIKETPVFSKETVTKTPATTGDVEPLKYVITKDASGLDKNLGTKANKLPKRVIVIDAGHGGKDPGTIGDYAQTKEKNITLSYSKELKKKLDNDGLYKVFLTRDQDFFIPLRKRVEKARNLKADLFISIHANSIADSSTSGFSIYTLSEKSSDKQAELLAQKENRADIIAGANFAGASPDVMKTLIDLSQRESKNSSSKFANIAIRSIKNSEIQTLQNTHRFAGFAVLTAPDMASVLIELGYLSNKEEEEDLNSLTYKRKLVASIAGAIDEYFAKMKN